MKTAIKLTNDYSIMDLGGRLSDDLVINDKTIYRSGKLSNLSSDELCKLQSLGIKTILDLRTHQESAAEPDPIMHNVNRIQISAIPEDVQEKAYEAANCSSGKTGESCSDRRSNAFHESIILHNDAYKKMFDLLLTKQTPLLVHCNTGMDLSGTACMLILLSLGASDKQALNAYLNTGDIRDNTKKTFFTKLSKTIGFNSLQDSIHKIFALKQMETIHNNYGTSDAFLSREYNLRSEQIDLLRDLYTERSTEIDQAEQVHSNSEIKRYHCIVSGKVQGVGFRSFATNEAVKRNLTGSVANLENDTVELFIQGNTNDIQDYLKQLKNGNKYIHIKAIQTNELPIVQSENKFIYHNSNYLW